MGYIKFHAHLSLHFANALVGECNRISNASDAVTLDFSDVQSIKPFAITLLYLSSKQYFKNHDSLSFLEPKYNKIKEYMQQVNTRMWVDDNLPTSFRLFPIGINYQQKIGEYLEIIKYELPHNSDDLLFNIRMYLSELAPNVFQHSDSQHCVVCGQIYQEKNEIHISITDMGIGFKNSLKSVRPSLGDDGDAIRMAVEEKITSRKNNVGGWGLTTITASVMGLGGSVTYISGNGMITYKRNEIERKIIKNYLQGVSINIVLPLLQNETNEQPSLWE